MARTTASTRDIYGKTLLELGREDPNIVVLGGDLNKSVMTTYFAKEFPQRFFDCGAAEQNIISIAAGLASSGKTPFASTFAVFGTARPFDQIRISVSQPHLNVKIVCTHAGITVGEDGVSAQGIEDLALMCALPGFNVVAPADAVETVQAVRVAAKTQGPFYIRLYRPATPVVCGPDYTFILGKAALMRDGPDATIIAYGIMVAAALDAAESLEKQGLRCRVLNMSTLQPFDADVVTRAARETGAIVTAEEHYRHGGLASLVAQTLAEQSPAPQGVVALDGYAESGKADELLAKYGLTARNIERAVLETVGRKQQGLSCSA